MNSIRVLLSIKTVEKHRQSLMVKLNIHKTAVLTRYAVSSGVVEVNRAPIWLASRGLAHEPVSEKRLARM
ncbi:MAG TPA: hypothetical protein VG146_15710 [Verrucomicrobiae bacterium]|nr:hypothetical protein [Verrucomicrobiae bacterium]